MKHIMAEVEALIMSGHGLAIQDIIRLSGRNRNEILETIDQLQEAYSHDDHGIELKNVAGKYSFFTKNEYFDLVSKIRKKSVSEITNSQMQVLAIVAYNQPLTLKEMEKFRGSACTNQIKELISMGLIKRKRDKTKKGNPYFYVTTENFLKALGISSLSDLKEDFVENTEISEDVRNNITPEI
jgi:segregation and condensation protein B